MDAELSVSKYSSDKLLILNIPEDVNIQHRCLKLMQAVTAWLYMQDVNTHWTCTYIPDISYSEIHLWVAGKKIVIRA